VFHLSCSCHETIVTLRFYRVVIVRVSGAGGLKKVGGVWADGVQNLVRLLGASTVRRPRQFPGHRRLRHFPPDRRPSRFPKDLLLSPSSLPKIFSLSAIQNRAIRGFQNLIGGAVYGADPRFTPSALVHDLVPDVSCNKYYRRYATPMFFKSHALPCPEYRRVVYLLRDGRDAMVSYRHYREAIDGVEYDFMKFVTPETALYPCHWPEHVELWIQNPYHAQMLVIKYEDLLRDPVRELKRFCQFAGMSRETDHLTAIAEGASFRNLRDKEARMGFGRPDHNFPPGKFFFRRGVVGCHRTKCRRMSWGGFSIMREKHCGATAIFQTVPGKRNQKHELNRLATPAGAMMSSARLTPVEQSGRWRLYRPAAHSAHSAAVSRLFVSVPAIAIHARQECKSSPAARPWRPSWPRARALPPPPGVPRPPLIPSPAYPFFWSTMSAGSRKTRMGAAAWRASRLP
jgi:hypothetical protein